MSDVSSENEKTLSKSSKFVENSENSEISDDFDDFSDISGETSENGALAQFVLGLDSKRKRRRREEITENVRLLSESVVRLCVGCRTAIYSCIDGFHSWVSNGYTHEYRRISLLGVERLYINV